jgi:trans-aconitate methyltransferase
MKEIETVRTHDKLYLFEDRKRTPKEYFKFILKEINLDAAKDGNILDIGCATGDFLWFLGEQLPNAKLVGLDIDNELIDRAKSEVPNADFVNANIIDAKLNQKFDLIFMLGVNSIFDRVEDWLDPMERLLRDHEKAAIYVFGLFNPEDLDVLIRSRPSSSGGPWETGWNLFSKKTVRNYCANKGWQCSFKDFKLDVDIKKNESDPLRSYTMLMNDNNRLVVNGLQLVHRFSLLSILPYL